MPASTAQAVGLRNLPGAPHAVSACGSVRVNGESRETSETQTAATPAILLAEIMAFLRRRFAALNRHYEAAWTESWTHRRCEHAHANLIDAAKCGTPHGAGWYVFAVEYGSPRELTDAEDRMVNELRFGSRTPSRSA
jgi:hypothetical protein